MLRLPVVPVLASLALIGLATPAYSAADPPATSKSGAAPATAPASRSGPAKAAPLQPVTSVEGITEYRLANGLTVLLFPDPSKPTITVNVTYLVGSRHENYGETGMAHLLEHLMFKGTPHHPNVPKEVTAHGARTNGTTSYDRTNYFETFTATDENLRWALAMEADRMVHSFIRKQDLDSEMTVVRNEYEAGENNPLGVLMQRIYSTAYLSHAYSHSVIGVRSDIENVPIERLQAFYRLYYQPDNAVLLVSGRITPAKTLRQIQRSFGVIPHPERKLPVFYTQEPTQDGAREVELRRVGDTQVVAAGYHVPSASHADFAALHLMTYLLVQNPGGRLYKSLVESHKAADVFAQLRASHDPGLLILAARLPTTAPLESARSTLLSTVEQLAESPPTAEEMERVRSLALKQMERELDESDSFGVELSEWMAAGDWRLFFLHRDRLRNVQPVDIQRVAGYLKPSNRTAGVYLPTQNPARASIPENPDVAALLKDYKGDAVRAQGEVFDPSPAAIDARTQRSSAAGLKIALLPKKTRGSTVVATLQLHFGDEHSLLGQSDIALLCGQMLMRGTQHHTRQQLQDEINRLKANVSVSGGATGAFMSIQTTTENLAQSMTLAAEALREPTFPAEELDIVKRQIVTTLTAQRSEPQSLANIALQKHMNPFPKGDVRYTPSLDERIESLNNVTLDQIKDFYRRFYGTGHGELAVVGDFDPAQIAPLVTKLFDGWRSPAAFAHVPQVFHDVSAENQSIRTPDKTNAYLFAAQNLELRDDDPDYPALVMGNYLLGGGFISSRLATRVRQKDGLSYGIGSQLNASAEDRAGSFGITAISAPQNTAKVEAAVREELERALKDGFTAEELNSARSGLLQTRAVARSDDGNLSRALINHEYLGRTHAWDGRLEERIRALTPQDIVTALRKHLDPAKLTIIKGGDFAASAKAPD